MQLNDIKLLFEYNYWANYRLVATCGQVSPEVFSAPNSSGAGLRSLRATMLHILDGERSWRLTCLGQHDFEWGELSEADFHTPDELKARWQLEESEMRAYLDGLSDAALQDVIRYPLESGTMRVRTLWHCLVHLINHGTQHRSEAAMLLSGYGQEPGDFDFTLFLNQYLNLPA